MLLLSPKKFTDYELIDCGDFLKLERFGKLITIRPEPQAVWSATLNYNEWLKMADVVFEAKSSSSGTWKKQKNVSPPQPQTKVNSSTSPKENKTLADEFQKITSLKETLTINQKFMFTKALFQGDFEKFTDTIQHIDNQREYKEAMLYLENYLNDWDQESEEFHEFMELIEKRFL